MRGLLTKLVGEGLEKYKKYHMSKKADTWKLSFDFKHGFASSKISWAGCLNFIGRLKEAEVS